MTPAFVLERPSIAARNDAACAHGLARQFRRPTLVSRLEALPFLPDPVAFLHAASRELGHGVLWEQTSAGIALAGAGIATSVSADGASRFGAVSSAITNLAPLVVREDNETFPLLGGFAFTPGREESSSWTQFPDALLAVPRVLVQIAAGSAWLRVTSQVASNASPADIDAALTAMLERARQWVLEEAPEAAQPSLIARCSVPERPAWESSIAAAVSLIDRDILAKIVLAREERLEFDHAISPAATLLRLRHADPAATRFAIQRDGFWFIGSTPERLVRLRNSQVDVTCLAGSIGIGRHHEETETLARELLASAKNREEHEIVVRSTIEALEQICGDVSIPPGSPRVTQARSVQHLETPVTARMARPGSILGLVERLHPTPAVGGYPRDRALIAIPELESIDRGWYAAPVGWTDLHGDGEFAVAIRSALLTGRSASLFAGCGIVAGSVPAAEWEETLLKLRPMLAALGVL